MATVNMWAGGATQSGFVVKGRVDSAPDALLVSPSSDMSNPISFPVSVDGDFFLASATGLDSRVWYHYALSFTGAVDLDWVGRVRTSNPRGKPGGFSFAAWSCAGSASSDYWHPEGQNFNDAATWSLGFARPFASNHPGFESIESRDTDFLLNMGDLHYWDIPLNDTSWFHMGYDYQLEAPRQRSMWKSAGMVYMWDDHDYGPNDGDVTNDSRPAALQAYRQRIPSHDVPSDPNEPPYHSFVNGRVRFIVTDVRADRDPKGTPDGKVFRQTQEDWFIGQLEEARRQHQVVCWVNCKPWIAAADLGEDHWGGYAQYRDALLARMTDTDMLGQMYAIGGDMHALAIDDGRNNSWGGFPVFQLASIDAPGSSKGGPYWKGPSQGRGRYGVVTHADNGESVTVTVTGYIEESVWDSYTHVFSLPAKVKGASGGLFPAVPTTGGWKTFHAKALAA